MVEPGTLIDGRYRVLSRLGSGGMADVYLATDELLGRQVAVKLLHQHFAEDQEFVERFRREASSAAALSHPNIVAIFDRGEWQGTYYIAMEYVAGRSLKTIVRETGPLEASTAIDIVVQILRAARFAHHRGVIHRDLKPHNVILDEEARARVTDFGIARAGASDMTLTGSIMGTAQYLSPEQAQGWAVSATSDLYSIGVILYELLAGAVPFEADSAVAIAYKQVSAQPQPPSERNPAVSPSLDAVVLRALAKDPQARFADADEFIAVLTQERAALPAAAAAGSAGSLLLTAPPAPAAIAQAPNPMAQAGGAALLLPSTGSSDGGMRRERQDDGRRRRLLLWALAALLIAGAVVGLALGLGGQGGRVRVPDVTGQSEAAASARLRAAGLTPAPTLAPSATVASGLVASESPAGGTRVARGTRVDMVVSSGPGSAALPSVEGLPLARALSSLRAAGFKPVTRTQASASVPAGRVVGTDPPVGTEKQLGSPVAVLVSSGPARARVPDVGGDSQSAAEAALANAGFLTGTVTKQNSSTQPVGTVLAQSPSARTLLRAGAKVNLTVAQAPSEVGVPNVVGQSESQAAAALGGAGLAPRIAMMTVSRESQVGIVLKQSPSAGHTVHKGATVTLTVGVLGTPTTTTTTPTSTTPTTTTPTTTTTTTTTPPPAGA